jgi:fused signal recognition particle receptor
MFKFLKDKLKNWTEKFSERESQVVEEKEEKKKNRTEKRKKTDKEIVNREVLEKLKEKSRIKEIPVPLKFEVGEQKYEPDIERLKEISEEIEEKPGTESFFRKIVSKIQKVKISEETFDIYAEELEMILLENNVAFEVADEIVKRLRKEIVGQEFLKKEVEEQIKDALKEIIEEILINPFDVVEKIKNRQDKNAPFVILFCGINGTGKTTTVAKISDYLKREKISSVLAAGDTFRAASIEQLKKHGEKLGVKVISHEYNSDPAAVGFDAITYAKKNRIDCVLIDTAGRMHTAKNLLKEIEKISKICKPDLKIFVGESITGNDAIEQVRSFNWSIGIDGIILTKADVDEKGGTALSVGFVTKKPILFLGTGQEYEAIEVFDKNKFIERLGL